MSQCDCKNNSCEKCQKALAEFHKKQFGDKSDYDGPIEIVETKEERIQKLVNKTIKNTNMKNKEEGPFAYGQTDALKQLKQANKKRVPLFGHELNDWSLTDWGNAVAGETGELCNVLKKIHRGDMTLEQANEKELIADEAADIVCYLDLLCQRAGIDLQTAIVNKFNKVSERVNSDIKIYYY